MVTGFLLLQTRLLAAVTVALAVPFECPQMQISIT